jgi:hypothetical protein
MDLVRATDTKALGEVWLLSAGVVISRSFLSGFFLLSLSVTGAHAVLGSPTLKVKTKRTRSASNNNMCTRMTWQHAIE